MTEKILKTRIFNRETYKFTISRDNDSIVCYTPDNCFGYPNVILLSEPMLTSIDGKINHRTRYAYGIHRDVTPWILKEIEKTMLKLERDHDIDGKGFKHFTLNGEPLILTGDTLK